MTLPPLPTRTADCWEMAPAFEKTGSIYSVSAHAGRVLVGSDGLYRLRAGAQSWQYRKLPSGIGAAWKVAQEPRAPWRQAIASEEGVAIFVGKEGEGRVARIQRSGEEEAYVTNLVWGIVGDRAVLFVLWDDGEVVRLYPDRGAQDVLDVPPMAALAGDGDGSVAMLAWEEQSVYVLDGSGSARFRVIEFPREWYEALPEKLEDPFHLAVAGKAVALSVGWEGAFVTRDIVAAPFEKCEPLALAGALAFEGASPDSALFGALVTDAFTSIVRGDASGGAVRIGDMAPVKGRAWPFDEIAWDATRRRIFAVHRQAGLVVATAPDAKGGKLAAPN